MPDSDSLSFFVSNIRILFVVCCVLCFPFSFSFPFLLLLCFLHSTRSYIQSNPKKPATFSFSSVLHSRSVQLLCSIIIVISIILCQQPVRVSVWYFGFFLFLPEEFNLRQPWPPTCRWRLSSSRSTAKSATTFDPSRMLPLPLLSHHVPFLFLFFLQNVVLTLWFDSLFVCFVLMVLVVMNATTKGTKRKFRKNIIIIMIMLLVEGVVVLFVIVEIMGLPAEM